MDKIYVRAKDKYVRSYKMYGKSGDSYLYADSACETKVKAEEAKNLFTKGVIVDVSGKMYTAVGCTEEAGVVSLAFLTDGGSGTATLMVLKSDSAEE